MTAGGPLIYLIAGEQSGDVLGARLIRAIRRRRPDATIIGIGGHEMAAEGVESLFPITDLAIMGLLEVLPRIRRLKALLRRAIEDVQARKPDVLVTIDSPGFTLRVLGALRDSGIKRAHYVAPQIWAWRENRVKRYPGLWDELLCLLPFEPAFFARHGLPGRFVGHPVLESGADSGNAARFRAQHGVAADARILTVMPGSRHTEVSRLLPILEQTLRLLPAGLVPVVPLAGPVAKTVRQRTAAWPVRPILVSTTQEKFDAFAASTAALTKSGTSTLELAVARVPMLVMYRVNPISGVAIKLLAEDPVRLDPEPAAGWDGCAGIPSIRRDAGKAGWGYAAIVRRPCGGRGPACRVRQGTDDAASSGRSAVRQRRRGGVVAAGALERDDRRRNRRRSESRDQTNS